MKIAIAGSGYVGLSLAVLLAQHHEVKVIDVIKDKVESINNRKSPIKDEAIEKYLVEKELNLEASLDPAHVYKDVEYAIIATPTNYDVDLNQFDTSSVEAAIKTCMEYNDTCTIVIKSTIPEGYTKEVREKFNTDRIIFSPEFLRESKALYDNLYPSRIVVGTDLDDSELTKRAWQFADLLKGGAIKEEVPILVVAFNEAEVAKLFSNTYLATRVAYFNEIDTYSEVKGLNPKTIIDIVYYDPRIGSYYNNPSFGYGGYCLPKDTKQLKASFRDVPENLITAVVQSNKTRKDYIAGAILAKQPSVVGIYRLIMKSDSDNFRSSAVKGVMERLDNYGKEIVIYEPTIECDTFMGYRVIKSLDEFKNISDIVVANRMHDDLRDIQEKLYTRDLFGRE